MPHAIRALAAALLVAGCTVSTRNLCEADGMEHIGTGVPRDCHVCTRDEECIFQGNVCEGVVYCAHHDAELTSTAIGCSPEPARPDDSACVCRDGYCQVF
jgi:hypothetical protein